MNKLEGTSMDLTLENIKKLKELFPNAVIEGKIDFNKLRLILGDEVDEKLEKYQFTWNGKSDTIRFAQAPSTGTLIPCKEKSKSWDTTDNLYIEGDNLEVLKILQKTYHNKIKMIYIDPPYNTGGEFVYKDNFKDNITNYKEITNQKSRSNPETSGRYHTDWLNMMYSRLMLAKNLLSEDGVIFISIDDNEMDNLRKICCEIFGEYNFVGQIVRKTKLTSNKGRFFSPSHEYILVYAKNINDLEEFNDNEAQEDKNYIKLFKHSDERGKYNIVSLYMPSLDKRPNQRYYITCPDGSKAIGPEGKMFRWTPETFMKNLRDNRVVFIETKTSPLLDENGNQSKWNVYTKLYLHERQEKGLKPVTFFDRYPNSEASKELIKMNIPFDFSKPRKLIQYLLKICNTNKDSIILDFFAGSSTTAHAVMQLNAEDGGNRKYIMVQLPELIDEKSEAYIAGYKNICEIGQERIRRAGDKIKQDLIEKKEKAGMLTESIVDPDSVDFGFKVFKLDSTNINPWDGNVKLDKVSILGKLQVIKDGRTKEDVLYEIMLKYGVFDMPVEKVVVNGKIMYSVGKGYLIICLVDKITLEDVKGIGELKPRNVIFEESGFETDNDKINAIYTLERFGVEEIKSI